jgi:hypothetical protein
MNAEEEEEEEDEDMPEDDEEAKLALRCMIMDYLLRLLCADAVSGRRPPTIPPRRRLKNREKARRMRERRLNEMCGLKSKVGHIATPAPLRSAARYLAALPAPLVAPHPPTPPRRRRCSSCPQSTWACSRKSSSSRRRWGR